MYHYSAEILRVIDGDTIRLRVDMGFRITATDNFRLRGVNTPELRGDERELGLACLEHVEQLLAGQRRVQVRTHKAGKYGRWLCDITCADSSGLQFDLAELLIKTGWALPYDGRGKMPRFDAKKDYPMKEKS